MKKIAILVFAIFVSVASYAQISVGPKLGLNLAKVSDGEDTPDGVKEPFKLGLNIGAAANFEITEMFSIQPELSFSQKGFAFKAENSDDKLAFTHNYIDIPVLVKVSFGSDNIKGYVNAGPQFGYWTGGSYKMEGTVSRNGKIKFGEEPANYIGSDLYVPKEEVNRAEIAAAFGGGVAFGVGNGKLLIDLRYTLGLSSVGKKPDNATSDWKPTKNNVIGISAIYLFSLGQ